ncbi:MAG: hypothetical protein IPH45_18895 [Bacteroidales bacterium]|nr:hypothetical protein [Bacteroidales bacterium]
MSFEKKDLDTLNLHSQVKPHYFSEFSSLHYSNMLEIFKKHGVEQDDAYRDAAIQNIKNHPVKYLKNCYSNLSRILFNFPYSYKLQSPDTLLRIPFNGLLVMLMLLSLIPTLKNWINVENPIKFLLIFSLIYLGGSILASAETRMFSVVVPFFIYWVATVLIKTTKFQLKFHEKELEQ